jgi:ketosteroid isomerase-like protein
MTITRRQGLLGLLALVPAARAAAQSRVRSDQEILIQLERDWDEAFLRKDLDFIRNVLADEFMATYPDGSRGNKERELTLVAEFNLQIDSSHVDDFIVRVYRDTAVVWFTQQLVGPVQGRPVEIVHRYIDVFVIRDGRWQCVASQSTRVTAPPTQA